MLAVRIYLSEDVYYTMKNFKLLLSSMVAALSICVFHNDAMAAKHSTTLIHSYNAQNILYAINQYRLQRGLGSLKLEPAISEEAKNHSLDMAENIVPFGHDGFYKRAHQLAKVFPQSHAAAENAAYAYTDDQDVVKQWINSPDHRKNIEGNYNLTGIGVAYDKTGKVYVTQLFLRDDSRIN